MKLESPRISLEQSVKKGSNVSIGVIAEGNPRPTLEWALSSKGKLLDGSLSQRVRLSSIESQSSAGVPCVTSSITLRDLQIDDSGTLTACAANDAGSDSISFNLVVKGNSLEHLQTIIAEILSKLENY